MNREAARRLGEHLTAQGLEAALLSSPYTVTWLTGYAAPIETGPSPFEGGPAIGWWRAGQLTLALSDTEAPSARGSGVDVREYAGYTLDQPLRAMERHRCALSELLGEHASVRGRVGVECDFLPAPLWETLRQSLPHACLLPIDEETSSLRMLKTAEEIEKIRASLELCDIGQAYIRDHIAPGITELDLWVGLKGRLRSLPT
jgi:Xaa-Pro aminopeptidase